MTKTSKIF